MDFKFSEEQNMLREAFAEFVKEDVAPNAAVWDREDHCPVELFEKMGSLGILGVYVPEQYGGVGLGQVERLIAIEEIARHSPGLAIAVFTHQLLITGILDYGTDEQKVQYLPDLCAGKIIGTLGATEPGGGSDFAGQKTTAEFADGTWTINGRKCFITNSHIADIVGVTARTGTDEKNRALFSMFIIEKGTPGFLPGREENKLGLRGSITGELLMDNVKVPEKNLLGKEGKGNVALTIIGEIGRASISAICVGILRGCLEDSVKFANERIMYGQPISKLQAIQFHIAENRIDYEAAKLLCYRAASLKDEGVPVVTEFSMAKHFGTEAACRASKRTIELMGGYGIIDEYPTGRYMRDALTAISAGATSEIQRLVVAGDTLKKYS